MKIGIMQPYFFPYIGYWQLLNHVDKYIIYDDVNFIKGGWINRNRILLNNNIHYINVPMIGASSNKLINEIAVDNNIILRNKMIKTIEHAYSTSQEFSSVMPLIQDIFLYQADNLGEYLFYSILQVADYLNIKTEIILSSSLHKNNEIRGQEKVISICKLMGATEYINAIGGQHLYDFSAFEFNGIQLKFLKSNSIQYDQGKKAFVENLSIIDILMHNSKEEVTDMLAQYSLVTSS